MICITEIRRKILPVATLFIIASSVAAQGPEYGVCEKQLVADVASRFNQNVTKIDWSLHTERDSRSGYRSQAVVYTDGCPGYYVYDIFGKEYDCFSRAHYGEVRNYIRYRSSGGGCQADGSPD
jgi:hypothetical protein